MIAMASCRRTLCEMCAVMIGLNAAGWVGGVGVKRIEMGTDLFDWSEVLNHRCSGLQHLALHCPWVAWDFLMALLRSFGAGHLVEVYFNVKLVGIRETLLILQPSAVCFQ